MCVVVLLCCCVVVLLCCCCVVVLLSCCRCVVMWFCLVVVVGLDSAGPPSAGPPSAGPPSAGPPSAGPPSAGPPKISLFFFPFPPPFRSFCVSLGVFSLNFGGVFEGQNPKMCTFGLSGCRVKPRRPHQTGPPGLAHDSPRLQTCTFEGSRASKTPPKFHEKTPRETQ